MLEDYCNYKSVKCALDLCSIVNTFMAEKLASRVLMGGLLLMIGRYDSAVLRSSMCHTVHITFYFSDRN